MSWREDLVLQAVVAAPGGGLLSRYFGHRWCRGPATKAAPTQNQPAGLLDCTWLEVAAAQQELEQGLPSGLYTIKLESGRSGCKFSGYLSLKSCTGPNVVDAWPHVDYTGRQW